MLREIRRVGEALGAGGTLVGLGVLLVDLLAVDQHVRLGVENLKHTHRRNTSRAHGQNVQRAVEKSETHTYTGGTLPEPTVHTSDLLLKI